MTRELPAWLKHATAWLLIGTAVFLGVQSWQARQRATQFVLAEAGAIEIRRAGDGHYHWPGRIAGRAIEFLVDTGATRTAIPLALAERLGLESLGSAVSNTAGGVVTGSVVRADVELHGGVRVERLRIVALPDLSAPLLGMDVLGRLQWRQENGVLHIEPRPPGGRS
jgi:aspartyl protease family protein